MHANLPPSSVYVTQRPSLLFLPGLENVYFLGLNPNLPERLNFLQFLRHFFIWKRRISLTNSKFPGK